MTSPSWNDDHAKLLTDARPSIDPASDEDMTRFWNRVATVMEEPARPHRRRARLVVAAAIAATLTGISGVAVADLLTARTGRGPSSAEDLSLGGPGEKLDLSAPDLREVIAEESADIPFASEAARQKSLDLQARQNAIPAGREVNMASTGAFRGWIADDAVCSWANQWARATRAGDGASKAQAAGMIQAAPSWAAVVALDPKPFQRWEEREVYDGKKTWTERYLDHSRFFYLGELGQAVNGTDPAAVAAALVASGAGCNEELVPDLPDAYPPNVMK